MQPSMKLINYIPSLLVGFLMSCSVQNIEQKPESTYSTEDIIRMAEWRFNLDINAEKICDLFILDGVPFEKKRMDSLLLAYDRRDMRMITFLHTNDAFRGLYGNSRPCDWIPMIQTNDNKQSNAYKREILNKVIDAYQRYEGEVKIAGTSCSSCPMVVLDGRSFHNDNTVLETLRGLKIGSIEFVANYQLPHNPVYFGAMGKNGVVEIFSK